MFMFAKSVKIMFIIVYLYTHNFKFFYFNTKNPDLITSRILNPQCPSDPSPCSYFRNTVLQSLKLSKVVGELSYILVLACKCRRSTAVEEILAIEIRPGWKKGTKITFPEKGNEQRGVIPSDLVFIIDEKPHAVFKRDGNDLVITQKISLAESLTGYTAQITTLDGRNLMVQIDSVISPTYEEVVKGEGMPIPKEPTKKGNLRIKFDIKFPALLTSDQKTGIKQLLTSS